MALPLILTSGNFLRINTDLDAPANINLIGATPLISTTASNQTLTLKGNRDAGDAGTDIVLNSSATRTAGLLFDVQNHGTTTFSIGFAGATTWTQIASWTGTQLTLTCIANTTNLTASVEVPDINLNLARTVTWATGALTTQRAAYLQAPTYAFAGALWHCVTISRNGTRLAVTFGRRARRPAATAPHTRRPGGPWPV